MEWWLESKRNKDPGRAKRDCMDTETSEREVKSGYTKTQVLGKAVAYGDEWLGNESVGKRENEIAALPTGNQEFKMEF